MSAPPTNVRRQAYTMAGKHTDRPWVSHGDIVTFIDTEGKTMSGKAIRFQPGYIVLLVKKSAVMHAHGNDMVPDMALYGVPYGSVRSATPSRRVFNSPTPATP